MNWLNSFKAAIVEEDERRIAELLDSMPLFNNMEDMQETLQLIAEATKKFEAKRDDLGRQMNEIDNERRYITSTSYISTTLLDVHS
ncbi:hypothetical protein NNO_0994 [Hydrogenimonas sp.]|nr:hypothetical protein NNO_0994 [Hydrogenimonas sp.]